MKRILRGVLLLLAVFLLTFIVFYFWASSPTQSEDTYAKVYTNNYDSNITNDSVYSIVTYNIGYLSGMTNNLPIEKPKSLFDDNMAIVLKEFKKSNPDIIVFQEIDYEATRSFDVNQQDEIAKLGYNYVAEAINWDEHYVPFPYWPISMNFGKVISGQSILSKYPLSNHERIVLKRAENNPFYKDAFYIERLAQVATINLDGQDIKIINVHLEAFDKPTRDEHTDYVLNLFDQYSKEFPTILLGDFNSDPDYENAAIDKILNRTDIGNAAFSNDNYENTYDTANPYERIDFIFYTPETIEYIDGRVMQEFGQASDHLPVEMRFRLKYK